jgi:hypothetical protein
MGFFKFSGFIFLNKLIKRIDFILILALMLTGCLNQQTNTVNTPTYTTTPSDTPKPTETEKITATLTATATVEPTKTATATEIPVTPSATKIECNINDVIEKLEKKLNYSAYEIFYTNFKLLDRSQKNGSYLNIWFVDPSLDPSTDESEQEENFFRAFNHAIELSHDMVLADECVKELVSVGIYAIVVDRNYNGWFAGIFPIEKFPNKKYLVGEDRSELFDSAEFGLIQMVPPQPIVGTPASHCRWVDVSKKISDHFPPDQPNSAIYLLRVDGKTLLYSQWVETETNLFDDANIIESILVELQCLYTPIGFFNVISVDRDGNLLMEWEIYDPEAFSE